MNRLILTGIALLAFSPLVQAQTLLNIYCEDCRDLSAYPEDARNFSYNQVFGPQSWLSLEQADRFRVTDSFGNTVTIDMNMDYRVNLSASRLFDLGEAGLLVVDGLVIQVRVIYQNLDIETYLFTRLDVGGELPVGGDNTRSSSGGSGQGDGEDGDVDNNDAADHEYEDTIYDVLECDDCTLQQIYPDGDLGDPIDMPTNEEWEEMQEL